ncbi:MAG: hypothetical protein GYB65_20610, partial [Chloroflexi bacterium]|nr:hypothetical protein [Chloroflexota bacterium]
MSNLHVVRVARQRRNRRRKQGLTAPVFWRWAGIITAGTLGTLAVFALIALLSGWLTYRYYARQLPAPDEILVAEQDIFRTTILYDRTGQTELYKITDPEGGDRQPISIDDVPQVFIYATVAIEDKTFYDNPGFDLEGIARALWNNVTGGQIQGGSTITQQLVRNVLLDENERYEDTIDRKVKEVILATELSRVYSKDQILEWYINTNYYGGWAYGIEAAAEQYFRKSARDLTLAEAAILASIPQSPSLNPINSSFEVVKQRQLLVLEAMVDQGYITQAEADEAYGQTIQVKAAAERNEILAPHFTFYAWNEAKDLLDEMGFDGDQMLTRGGLRVYTTLDLDLQMQAECVLRTQMQRMNGSDPNFTHNTSFGEPCDAALAYLPELSPEIVAAQNRATDKADNGAAVVLRAQTGEVVAMVGSIDYWNAGIDGTFNVAAHAQRQPASAFKPIVYTAAFLAGPVVGNPNGITAATMTYDVAIEFDNQGLPYTPVNIDDTYHGVISVREALAKSYNVPPVQLANLIGLSPIVQTAHRMGIGIESLNATNYGLALALGSGEVSLLDLTYTYNVFNTGGYMVGTPVLASESVPGFRTLDPVSILRIDDAQGQTLWQYGEDTGTLQRRLILEPGLAFIMTDILSDEEARYAGDDDPIFPPGNALELSRPAAAKTGTSNNNRDTWTIGYTPQFVTGVWVGRMDNRDVDDSFTGLSSAAPIWHAIMEYAHAGQPIEEWQRPDTILDAMVCEKSGLLPTANCPRQVRELFYVDPPVDTRPQQADTYWKTYDLNVCNQTLATPSTPPECRETQPPYFDYPPETRLWARNAGEPFPPTARDTVDVSSPFDPVAITSPSPLDRVSGAVEISGNATDDNFSQYTLAYKEGTQGDTGWVEIGVPRTQSGWGIPLGVWNTSGLSDGALYTLRLTMVRQDGSLVRQDIQVTVDNAPPQIRLIDPVPNRTFSAGQNVYVPLSADVQDNLGVSAVEFYIDNALFERVEEAPYTTRWTISVDPGQYTIQAIAYDVA